MSEYNMDSARDIFTRLAGLGFHRKRCPMRGDVLYLRPAPRILKKDILLLMLLSCKLGRIELLSKGALLRDIDRQGKVTCWYIKDGDRSL